MPVRSTTPKKPKKDKKKKILKHNTSFEKNLSISSRRYLERQARDPYVNMAQQRGYRSRAVFKLEEIDQKYKILKAGQHIVDLGAAPGGWSQYAGRRLTGKCTVVALDLLPIDPIDHVTILQGDFTEDAAEQALLALCPGGVDVVLSDMAPSVSGQAGVDHLRVMHLVELAHDFALKKLNSGGSFVCKIFMGGEEKKFAQILRQDFTHVHFFKPKASRAESREMFLVALGFKGKS